MAKTMSRMEELQCTCNLGSGLIGVILCAAALFFLVKGWIMQTGNEAWFMTYIWYLVGMVLLVAGHVFKKKGMNCRKCCGM
ncbi:MAG TPA: hypothetical protein VJB87_04790 [Candidatus Nanoarchaeia archaeon]|nr:hypothetical protein [Candidatus Nanoarchaeia archaeon]